jgi:hypothetical protein
MREDEEGSDDFGELLPDLDEPALDDDDSDVIASDDLDLEESPDAGGDEEPHELELGPDSVLPEAGEEAGDAAGLEEPDPGEAEPEDTLPADDEERDGIDDARPLVSDLDLPGLDADAEGTEDDAARFGALLAASELALPTAARPWQPVHLSPEREHSGALALGTGAVVAGSTDVLWLDAESATPVRLALDGNHIVSLTLLGEPPSVVVAVTATGTILRRARRAVTSERMLELGRTPEEGGPDARGIDLCGLAPEWPDSFLTRLPSGRLELSHDGGATLRPVEPRVKVRALSPTPNPIVAISEDGRALLWAPSAATALERRELQGSALAVASGSAPFLASGHGVVVVADSERGLVLSTDEGRSFREVAGSATVTACAVGVLDGRTCVFFALYSETSDAARLAMVDVAQGSAEVIAFIPGGGDDDSDEGPPSGRLDRLAWDGARLYAAGEPGFLSFEPPRNTAP